MLYLIMQLGVQKHRGYKTNSVSVRHLYLKGDISKLATISTVS